MATIVTRYVDPDSAGGDGTTTELSGATAAFASLAAWATARKRNLVTADEIEKVVCCSSHSNHTADTAYLFIEDGASAWTTDSTRYVWITTDAASRASSLWSDSKYRLSAADTIETWVDCVIDGLQIASTTGDGIVIDDNRTATTVTVSNCNIKGSHATARSGIWMPSLKTGAVITIYNCILDNYHYAGVLESGSPGTDAGTVTVSNCTTLKSAYGYEQQASTFSCTNCGADVTYPESAFAGTITQTTCSSASPTFVDEAGGDYRLAVGDTAWKGQGTDLSGTFTTDINGKTIVAPWSIGAAVGTTTVTHYVNPAADADGDGTTSALTSSDGTHACDSLQAWEILYARDLVAADETQEVICDTSGPSYPADVPCTIYSTSWKTDATRRIVIKAAAASKASAVWSDTKYRIDSSGTLIEGLANRALLIDGVATANGKPLWVEVDGIQILQAGIGSGGFLYGIWVKFIDEGETVTIKNCYIKNTATNSLTSYAVYFNSSTSGTCNVQNTIIEGYSQNSGKAAILCASGTINAQNCTIVNCYNGLKQTGGTLNATNCGVSNCTTPFSGTVTQTTCSTDTPQFLGATDYHIANGDTTWKNRGTDLSATFTDDIDGDTRSDTWDIGADEVYPSSTVTVTHYVDPDSEVDINGDSVGDGTTTALTGAHAAFASLQEWSVACARDLVALDETERVICLSSHASHSADARGVCTISTSWTTDATRKILIETDAASRHVGVWSELKYRMLVDVADQCIKVVDNYVDIVGLQFDIAASSGTNNACVFASECSAGVINVSDCIMRGTNDTSDYGFGIYQWGGAGGVINAWNCIMYDLQWGVLTHYNTCTFNGYNLTAYNCVYGFRQE